MSEPTPEPTPSEPAPPGGPAPAAHDPAPEPAPTEPAPEPPAHDPTPEPAPEAPEAGPWSDPEKGREAKRKANQEARKLRDQIVALQQQVDARVDPAETKAAIALAEEQHALELARVRAGYRHGVPEKYLDRLQGETPEEIEADAKALGAAFGSGGGLGSGGLDPTEAPVELDPKKLADQIPRLH